MKRAARSLKALAVAGALALGVVSAPKPAAAQEIQLTGPLAGAPSVRKQRLYREGRFELALGPGFTLLDEYERTIFLSGRLQYNIWDFLAIGVFGGYAPASLDTDLTDKIEATAPRNSRTAVNLPTNRGAPAFNQQTGKMVWMVTAPQLTFTPFRGKLALFQKLFIDTDIYGFGGLGIIGVKERGDCGAAGQVACTASTSFATQDRVALAPVFGLGWSFYPSNFISVGVEYRAFPFKYNRGGFDSRGQGTDASVPDNKVDQEDRTLKFNQMVYLFVGFSLPTTPSLSK